MHWHPIETAPHNIIVIVNDPEYAWATAQWDRNSRTGEGWFSGGIWMEPQPEFWLPVTPPHTGGDGDER